jgi:ribonuclease HI
VNYELWTDGSCNGLVKIGSWAYCIVREHDQQLLEAVSEPVAETTNNRMELQGVISGLRRFDPNSATTKVTVFSDSAYVINCFLQGWHVKWRKFHWLGSTGKEVKNRDLWEELLEIVDSFKGTIEWKHVKGHSGVKWNEMCDELAGKTRIEGMI